jgi:galactosamine-6-phosphate isomerase
MKRFITGTYAELSQQAAEDLLQLTANKEEPIVCTASGDTPAGLYNALFDKVKNKQADIGSWYFVGLDEWVGMNGDDQGSCRFHLNNQLFNRLQIADDRIIFFDGKARDLEKECEAVESFVFQHGGMDVAIVGLGMNGHIGMNEPGTSPNKRSHVTALDPITQKVGQKYFTQAQELTAGITLGLGTLMESKYIMLLVSGSHKAAIVKQMLEGEITEDVPASLLRNHPGLRIYLDKEAAQLLSS